MTAGWGYETVKRAICQSLLVVTAVSFIAGTAAAVPDPTRPPTAEEIRAWQSQDTGQPTAWRLESVLISERRKVAVINGRTVGVGDRVDGALVTAIEPGSVSLSADGRTLDLTLARQARSDDNRQDR